VADKLGLLETLASFADSLLIGGAMAFTFTQALGEGTGSSLVDVSRLDACKAMLSERDNIVLPLDFVAAAPGVELQRDSWKGQQDAVTVSGASDAEAVKVVGRSIPEGWTGYDIGPATSELFGKVVADAATVLWNGPMGVFEDPRFAAGTRTVAQAVADCTGRTVIGGGDSVAAVNRYGLADRIGHISTGGGASLELLEHGDLPGLKALRESLARTIAGNGDG
jgi:phosphoglycerate kinase